MSETSSVRPDNCRCDYAYLRNKKGPKFQGESTTHAQFKPYQLEKQQTFEAPKPQAKHYDPGVLQSSYKMQYAKPESGVSSNNFGVGDSSALMKSYMEKKSKVPFYSETSYKKNFEPHQIKVQKTPTYEYKPKPTKFEGSSSYKDQFQSKRNPDLVAAGNQIISASKIYEQRPKLKFQGQSSYKSTFQNHNVKAQKQPEYKYQPKNTKFEGQSSYKATFTELPKNAYKSDLEHCPVHPDRVAIK